MGDPRDTDDDRRDHLMLGEVVDNADPLGIGRVRVLVPGILDPESRWAHPMGAMRGVKNGVHWVPEVGSNVVVWLNHGDEDFPYYEAGPFGKPDGVSDVPEQAPDGSADHVVIRWRDFHITFNGKDGEEKLTIEDLGSKTKVEIDRTTGDYTRDVEGAENLTVKGDRNLTVEEGDENHTVVQGDRNTTVAQGDENHTVAQGNRVTSIPVGNDTKTLAAGNEVKTLAAGSSVETMPAGTKTITAGVAVTISAGTTVAINAGGAISMAGTGIGMNSAGTTSNVSTGQVTTSFLGGMANTVVGAVTWGITGAITWTVSGIALIAAAITRIGIGTHKKLLNRDTIAFLNAHTHAGPGLPPTQQILPGVPPYDENLLTTQNLEAS